MQLLSVAKWSIFSRTFMEPEGLLHRSCYLLFVVSSLLLLLLLLLRICKNTRRWISNGRQATIKADKKNKFRIMTAHKCNTSFKQTNKNHIWEGSIPTLESEGSGFNSSPRDHCFLHYIQAHVLPKIRPRLLPYTSNPPLVWRYTVQCAQFRRYCYIQ